MTGRFKGVVLAVTGLLAIPPAVRAQAPGDPVWWFGVAGAANLNIYEGTTQQLNSAFTTSAPFHKGFGVGLYLAPVIEYRPNPVWGGVLQLGYDDRRGSFNEIGCACDEKANLSAKPAYLSIEPSLRLSPFGGDLHLFAGPRLAFLWSPLVEEKSFEYTQQNRPDVRGDFSLMRRMVYSAQIGAGYDLEWTDWFPNEGRTRIQISPFVSYQPHFGQDPRDTDHKFEWWALSTLRAGAVLKFGRGKPGAALPDVRFSVRAPATVVAKRRIHETFPLRNYVYFGGDSLEFSGRYARLDAEQAAVFREEQLQDSFPAAPTGRSLRQMAVYHHILNIIGDRLRRNPGATITLQGLSAREAGQPRLGTARAEDAKRYLMRTFGIDGARIAIAEREEPASPLGRTGEELGMLRAENQRVEILSSSREMLLQVGEGERFMLKPVEIEGEAPGADSVVFHVAPSRGSPERAGSSRAAFVWSLAITDDSGVTRRFGPFARSREPLSAPMLLGSRPHAGFTAVMTGREEGDARALPVSRRAAFVLSQRNAGIHETLRFGILFDIDQARAVSAYDRFLAEVVASRISDTSTVFIRGRTDVVAGTFYNLRLSRGRAEGVLHNLESAAKRAGRRGVRFQPSWSGEDPAQAPFGNATPEERNHNRTVIIDIVPD